MSDALTQTPLEKHRITIEDSRELIGTEACGFTDRAIVDLADYVYMQRRRIARLEAENAQAWEAYGTENRTCESLGRQLDDAKAELAAARAWEGNVIALADANAALQASHRDLLAAAEAFVEYGIAVETEVEHIDPLAAERFAALRAAVESARKERGTMPDLYTTQDELEAQYAALLDAAYRSKDFEERKERIPFDLARFAEARAIVAARKIIAEKDKRIAKLESAWPQPTEQAAQELARAVYPGWDRDTQEFRDVVLRRYTKALAKLAGAQGEGESE